MLPLGPTSYGDSPYQSFSTYAGNPYFIDLDMLIEDGLLTRDEVESQNWGTNPRYVDYGKIYESRFALLEKAKDRGWERDRAEVTAFVAENARWLPDYALYMACKRHFGMRSWTGVGGRGHPPARKVPGGAGAVPHPCCGRMWSCSPICSSCSSASGTGCGTISTAWTSISSVTCPFMWPWIPPMCGRSRRTSSWTTSACPTEVSGVPPDYFSADGQLWGNPLYAWDRMQADGFGWWIRRIDGASAV